MRALVRYEYGSPDVARVVDLPVPEPAPGELLVRVSAASLNALDAHALTGEPRVMRLSTGLRRPREPQLGGDVAGIVERVGAAITDLAPGEEVFGQSIRTAAEFVVVSRAAVVPKPAGVPFDAAAATPVAGMTALQALRDAGELRAGQSVLVYGAAGGVGTFAVQLAAIMGAAVTAVCSAGNAELVRSLGARRVLDRASEDALAGPERYDLVLDVAGYRRTSELLRAVADGGRVVLIGAGDRGSASLLGSRLASRARRASVRSVSTERNHADLITLGGHLESGALRPVIDLRVGIEDAVEALRYVHSGHARGKAVIEMT